MFCEKCGNQLKATDKFCPKCGAVQSSKVVQDVTPKKAEMPVTCQNFVQNQQQSSAQNAQAQSFVQNQQQSSAQNAQAQSFVQNQQQSSAQNVQAQSFVQNQQQSSAQNAQAQSFVPNQQQSPAQNFAGNFNSQVSPKKTSKIFTKKNMLIGGVALGLVVVIAAGAITIPKIFTGGSGSKFEGVIYLKDHDLSINYKNKKESFQIEKLDEDYSDISATLSSDSKYLFYLDNYTLYRTDISKKKFDTPSEKISTSVSNYSINPNGTQAVILTTDRKLYTSDIKEKNKIDSQVSYFYTTENLDKIYYVSNDNNDLYYYENGKETTKIANDVNIKYISKDLSTIYYVSDDNLYFLKTGSEPQKLDLKLKDESSTSSSSSSTSSYSSYYESSYSSSLNDTFSYFKLYAVNDKTFFYLCPTEITLNIIDYIDDDMAETDKALTKPNYNDSKYKNNYSAYYKDCEEYDNKTYRDDLREKTITISTNKLFYFNGTSSVEISGNVNSVYSVDANDKPNAVSDKVAYFETDYSSVGKVVKMSDVTANVFRMSEGEITEKILPKYNLKYSSGNQGVEIASSDNISEYDAIQLSEDSKTLCYLYDDALYKTDISSDKVGEPVKTLDDIKSFTIQDNKIISLDKDDTLYLDDVKVADDAYNFNYIDGTLYYAQDAVSSSYTLMKFNGKESVKISDDVSLYNVIDDNNIYLLSDYNSNNYSGDLLRYNGKDTETIDTDVTYLYSVQQK